MITSTANSLSAAWANTRASGSRDPDTGQARSFGLARVALAVVGAVIWVAGPGVTIESWDGHASARLTSIRVARRTLAICVAVFAGLLVGAAVLVLSGWFYACVVGLLMTIIPLVVAAEVFVSARNYPPNVTHILTDVVRHPDAPPGSGTSLIEALAADDSRVIGAVARNMHLWQKMYAPHADQLDPISNGRTRFVLRSRAVERVG